MTEPNDIKPNINESTNVPKRGKSGDAPSFLDSIFFSSTALIIMTSVVVVAMLIMGWFVFEFASNKDWIDRHDSIIESAKKGK